ncbi:hypothetical protein CPC16_005812 [Podila verticillata]|nr:hypothetical protein CPC16_005812 [Podila verticillata]
MPTLLRSASPRSVNTSRSRLISLGPKTPYEEYIFGGERGNKNHQELEFCAVYTIPTDCITEGSDSCLYIQSSTKGYLMAVGGAVRITEYIYDLSSNPMIRYFLAMVLAMATFAAARHSEQYHFAKEILNCVPNTKVKEHHPFAIYSISLDYVLSKAFYNRELVGGMEDSRYLQPVVVCAVSDEMSGCDSEKSARCISEDSGYYLRVESPLPGYLSVTSREMVKIVDTFDEASRLQFSTTAGGIRIGHVGGPDGMSLRVFSAAYPGRPVELKDARTLAEDQIFELLAGYYYSPVRPIVIAFVVILIIFLVMSCVRRRRAQLALQQQEAIPVTELGSALQGGNSMYVYQYPPPQGSPMAPISSPYAPAGQQYSPPGQQYSYQPSNIYAPPPLPPSNAYSAYPPMPVSPPTVRPDRPLNATSNSPQFIPPQDGSAALPTGSGQMPGATTDQDGVPSVPPPPYTPAK